MKIKRMVFALAVITFTGSCATHKMVNSNNNAAQSKEHKTTGSQLGNQSATKAPPMERKISSQM